MGASCTVQPHNFYFISAELMISNNPNFEALTRWKNFIFGKFPYQFLAVYTNPKKGKNFEKHFHCSKQFFRVNNCLQLLVICLPIHANIYMNSQQIDFSDK